MPYNAVLLSGVIGWAAAQILKVIINLINGKRLKLERLVGSGGMPSSHSSTVCASLAASYRVCGAQSPVFAVMFILTVIVMYDAMNVRYAAGQHAREINSIRKYLAKGYLENSQGKDINIMETKKPRKDLKELLGHTPIEVICGAVLGLIIGVLIPLKR